MVNKDYHFDHPRSGVVIVSVTVCLYVCHTITVESFDVESSFSVCGDISM